MENQLVVHPLVASKALQFWHIKNGLWLRKGLAFDEQQSSSFASFLSAQLK